MAAQSALTDRCASDAPTETFKARFSAMPPTAAVSGLPGRASPPARRAVELRHPLPEPGLPAVPRPQPRHERLVRLDPAALADPGLQPPALEQVPRRVPVLRRLRALERVLDHRPPQQ